MYKDTVFNKDIFTSLLIKTLCFQENITAQQITEDSSLKEAGMRRLEFIIMINITP